MIWHNFHLYICARRTMARINKPEHIYTFHSRWVEFMSECILQTLQYSCTIIIIQFQYKGSKMLNTPLCSLENFCMYLCRLMLANAFYAESLFVVCRTESTQHPNPSKYVSAVSHFIITNIVCNCTTKLTWSMVHGDCIQQLNHSWGISDSTSWKYNAGSTTKYNIMYFTVDNALRSKCSTLSFHLMLRVLRNTFVVHP